jgi:hypothetical protein
MDELAVGLSEVLVTEGLQERLDELEARAGIETRALQPMEAPDRIAWHLSREIERALNDIGDAGRERPSLRSPLEPWRNDLGVTTRDVGTDARFRGTPRTRIRGPRKGP